MSTRSVIARKDGQFGFNGVYHHWDGYPSGVGKTLFLVRNQFYGGDTQRMLKFLIDCHPGGWSTINKDWSKPAGQRPDHEDEPCSDCGKPNWMHYRQYYKPGFSPALNGWERAGRPELPDGDQVMVLGHPHKSPPDETGPEFSGGKDGKVTDTNAADCGCEYAYVFDGNGAMEIKSSYRQNGSKMIGMFGCGDPESTWKTIAIVDLNGPEPDWDKIQA